MGRKKNRKKCERASTPQPAKHRTERQAPRPPDLTKPEMALEAAGDEVDARFSVPQPEVKLEKIKMADLTGKDSTGERCAFHEKKARDHGGWHLGGGSFGEVYKAVHKVHGDVAVKLAKPGKEDLLVMYQKEAGKHVLALTSKRIVSIIGFVQCEDKACKCGLIGIVMEYMENGTLWDFRISKWQDRPDLWPLTNRMVYQISSGMHFLHSKDIIHRDLKLENVLVDGNLHAKVADLGLATNLQTSMGDKCWGTNSHKPPEAFRTDLPNSTKVVTRKYDVYCFAMTLYELLTGIHPYSDSGYNVMKIFKVQDKEPPCLLPVPVSTPEELIRVMKKSWSYEAKDRPNFRKITDWVANLDTNPTHESLGLYLGKQKTSKKEGNTDHEPVRRGMQDLPMNDHTPVEQSNGNAAIPITETVTPNQVEGHESPPTHLIIQRSSSKKEGKKDDKSVGRGMENVTEQDQAAARYQSNTNAAVHDAQPVIDNESVRRGMEDLTVNDNVPFEQNNGNTAIPITETVTESHPTYLGQDNVVAQPEIQLSQPSSQESSKSSSYGQLKSQTSGPENGCHNDIFQPTVETAQWMDSYTGFIAHPSDSLSLSARQPLKSYREHSKEPKSNTMAPFQSSSSESPVVALPQPSSTASTAVVTCRPSSTEGPAVVLPQPSSTASTAVVPCQPSSTESPAVVPSQPRSTERDPTIIFDSSQPSDDNFEIKLNLSLSIQLRASIASKLDQILSSLKRCKHRDYWDSNSSLSTMFSFSDITLKSLQLPADVDEDDFTLYLSVCNKRDLDKLHELSDNGHLRKSLYDIFVDVHLKGVCRPAKPDLKVESWEEQFNKGKAHFQKKEKANESKKSDSEHSESRQKQPNENRSGASFTQTNCSGATQINTEKFNITMTSPPNNMVFGDQYNYHNPYRGSKGAEAGEGAGGHSSGRQPQKIKLCESREKVSQQSLLDIVRLISGNDVKSLGRHLGLDPVQVENIVYDNRHEKSSETAYQVLRVWIQHNGHQATKAVLANALWEAECFEAAKNVR